MYSTCGGPVHAASSSAARVDVFRLLCRRNNRIAAIPSNRPPRAAPTPTPTIAPVDSPLWPVDAASVSDGGELVLLVVLSVTRWFAVVGLALVEEVVVVDDARSDDW